MSLPIHVDAYAGHRANERPRQFQVDDDTYEIESIEDRWYALNGEFFKVRSGGRRFLLQYNEREDQWTLQSGFDGDELLARPGIELITVGPEAIREAQNQIAGCEHCRPDESEIPFDWILADVTDRRGNFDFVLAETARCPNCGGDITEKTLVEPQGGIEVETGV